MSALDAFDKLDGFDVDALDPLQRILLITDGTLTEILEAAFLERVRLLKLSQEIVPAAARPGKFPFGPVEVLLERKILLQGATSGRNYAYAESLIALDRFAPAFREALLNSDIPLGRLWLEHRLETFKEMQELQCRRAEGLSRYFDSPEASPLLVRTYRVFSKSAPVMTITEYFPVRYAG